MVLVAHGEGSTLVHVKVGDAKPVNAIVKEVQHDRVRGTVQHIDFWAVKMTQRIAAVVPLRFAGDSAGVKAGGVLTHNFTEVHIESLPADLPEYIEADVSLLEVGDSLKVSDLVVQMLYTISSLGYRKLSEQDRDLDQAKLAIETLRVVLPVLEGTVGDDVLRDFRQVTANLQLAYADASKGAV